MVLVAPLLTHCRYFFKQFDTYASGHYIVCYAKKTVCMCVKPKQLKSNIVHEFVLSVNNLKHVANHNWSSINSKL